MHGIFKTFFGTFALLPSVAYAIPKPRNIDISVRVGEDVLATMHESFGEEIAIVPEDFHTAEEFGVKLMVSASHRVSIVDRIAVFCLRYVISILNS